MLWRRAHAPGPLRRCVSPRTARMLRNRPGGQEHAALPLVSHPATLCSAGTAERVLARHGATGGLTLPLCFIAVRTYGSSITNSSCTSEALAAEAQGASQGGGMAHAPGSPRSLAGSGLSDMQRGSVAPLRPTPQHLDMSAAGPAAACRGPQWPAPTRLRTPVHHHKLQALRAPGARPRARTGRAPTRRRTAPGCPARPRSRP